MWATFSSPSTRTRPRVMVVLPAAESPTTPRITGRGTDSAHRAGFEHTALEDVLRVDPHEILATGRMTVLHLLVDTVGMTQACSFDRVAHAARVREARLPDAALQIGTERVLGLTTELVGLRLKHQSPDRQQ